MSRPKNEYENMVGEWSWNSEVLWRKIKKPDGEQGCWTWVGATGPQTNLFGARKNGKAQMTQARRILYREVTGEDCGHLQITHTCGNAYCMNHNHFEVKPNQQYYHLDGVARGLRAQPEKPVLKQAKLVPVRQARWWNV